MSRMKSLFERQLVPMDGQLAYGDETRPSREKQPAQQALFPTIYHNLAAKTATPEGNEPIYRPDLAHCIYCGAADEYVCTCDHRNDMWPELSNDTEIPF